MAQVRVVELPNLHAVARDVLAAGAKGVIAGAHVIAAEAQRIVREERFATGHLMQSIHPSGPFRDGGNIVATVSADAPYAPFVEYDTRPHVAPFAPFVGWATTKGFRMTGRSFKRSSKANTNLARAGWLAVKKRGTKGIHFMRRAFEAKHDQAKQLIIRYVREALARYAR
jgi:hypothetical protein